MKFPFSNIPYRVFYKFLIIICLYHGIDLFFYNQIISQFSYFLLFILPPV